MIHAMDSLAKKQLELLQNRQIALTEALTELRHYEEIYSTIAGTSSRMIHEFHAFSP